MTGAAARKETARMAAGPAINEPPVSEQEPVSFSTGDPIDQLTPYDDAEQLADLHAALALLRRELATERQTANHARTELAELAARQARLDAEVRSEMARLQSQQAASEVSLQTELASVRADLTMALYTERQANNELDQTNGEIKSAVAESTDRLIETITPAATPPSTAERSQSLLKTVSDPAAEPVLRVPPPKAAEQAAPKKQPGLFRRLAANPRYSQYYRLAALVFIANLVILYHGMFNAGWWQSGGTDLTAISTLAVSNFALSILVRQQYVINILFWLATRPSTRWPLSVRWACGKVYHHGGLHSAAAVAGSLWFLIFAGSLSYHAWQDLPGWSPTTLGVTYALLALLASIIILSLASLRARYHDAFERMHRIGGWTALSLFWISMVTFADDTRGDLSLGEALLGSAGFWLLVVITCSIILPWLRLKRVPVEIVRPSSHAAIVRFNYGDTPFPGSSNAISRNPLLEWHSFANIPAPGENGYRLIISRSGDWTGRFIDDMPSHVWVKGITTSGVARIEVLFKRVVYIATGSGIGPVMPHLLAKDVPIHLIWATRNPRKTYGDALVDEILEAVPDAVIWDTDSRGKPDLSELAYEACQSFDGEAVICISNQKLTRRVVEAMERQGIPAFGAIWDS